MSKKHNSFPSDNVSENEKNGADWCLKWCKAAWQHAETHLPSNIFYKAKDRYENVRQYMRAEQPIEYYQKTMRLDNANDDTMFPMDFTNLAIVSNRIMLLLGKLALREYNPVAIPVDALAKDELDTWYADVKAKILLKEQLRATNPDLMGAPALTPEPGEPQDLEELEMEMEFGSKRKRSKEAEMAIRLAFFWNKIPEVLRPQILEDLVYHGVGVYRDDLSRVNNKPKARRVDPAMFICNYVRRKDWSDLKFAGEVYELTIDEFEVQSQMKLTDDQKNEIVHASQKIFGGPSYANYAKSVNGRADDQFKVQVLDLSWYSTNTIVKEMRVNKHGNLVIGNADFKAQGKGIDRSEQYRAVYNAKWVIGTDYIFDYGMAYDQKRGFENWSETKLPYHIASVGMNDMSVYALGEKLIPMADALQISWLKIQSIRNQMIPNGFDIDMDALEDVAIGKGGKNMSPRELLDLFFQTGILINRRRDISTQNVNYKPINYIENNYGRALQEAWSDFQNNILLIREITGFNELTDGSTPNPKTLVPVARMAYESTNNSLQKIIAADKLLHFSLAEAMVIRMQQAIRRGPVEGYIKALGKGTVDFVRVSKKLDDRDYAIMLEDAPTDEEKAVIKEQMIMAEQRGLLTPQDIIYISSIDNLKQAGEVLQHRIARREKELHAMEMEKITANHKGQQESNMVAGQLEAQRDSVEFEHEMQIEAMKLAGQEAIAEKKIQGELTKQRLKNAEKTVN